MKTILFNIKYDIVGSNRAPSYAVSIYRQDVRNQKDFNFSQLSYPGGRFLLITASQPQDPFEGGTKLYVRGARYRHDVALIEIQLSTLLNTFSELLIRPYAFDHERCVL